MSDEPSEWCEGRPTPRRDVVCVRRESVRQLRGEGAATATSREMAGRSTVKVAPKSRATALRNRGTPVQFKAQTSRARTVDFMLAETLEHVWE